MTQEATSANPTSSVCAYAELEAVLSSYKGVDLHAFNYPTEDGWHLHYETMQFLVACVRQRKPRRMVEFGAGRSTEVLGTILGKLNGRLISVDHISGIAKTAGESLERCAPGAGSVFHCPIRPQLYGLKLLPAYRGCGATIGDDPQCDMALIDGPPWFIGREAVFYELFPRLAVGGWVIVDDANRPYEKQWLARWSAVYRGAFSVFTYPEIGMGVMVIVKNRSIAPAYAFPAGESLKSWFTTMRTMWSLRKQR